MKNFCKQPFTINEKAKKLILTMKLTVFILFLTLMQVSASVYSQATKFSFRAENKQVVEVLRQIEVTSDFRFFFLREQVDVERKVTVTAREATVEQILEELFKDQPVSYEFANEALIVLTHDANPLGSIKEYMNENMQQRTVSGTVTDESGQPLPGVTVVIKGTTQGTVTNADGNYSLTNIPENATLLFSFVGMRTQEIVVGMQTSINVEMEIDAIGIEEVVAVGYGTMKKSDITGSLSSVTFSDFEEQAVTRLDQALQGRATGVQVTQLSGEPGGSFKVRIRGANSISGDNDPLYVVDGIVVDGISWINPNDIASMEILKDASATAIYGSRGANGVVLVTTKNGKRGETKISVGSYQGVSQVYQRLDLMTPAEWAENINYVYESEIYSESEITDLRLSGGVDWQDLIFNNALFSNYQMTMNGGTEAIDFYISGDYYTADGTVRDRDYTRYTLRAKMNADLSEKIRIGFNFTGSREETTGRVVQLSKALTWDPTTPIYDENGDFNVWPLKGTYGNTSANPLMQPELLKNDGYSNKVTASGYFNFEPVKNLTLNIIGGTDFIGRESNSWIPEAWDGIGTAGVSFRNTRRFQNTNRLTYVIDKNPKHRLQIDAIHEQSLYLLTGLSGDATDFFTESTHYKNLSIAQIQKISNNYSKESLQSYLGRLNYSLLNRYLITASLRADGSSKFRKGHQWGIFPSGSVGWRVSEEGFMKNSSAVNNLKIRTSYGVTGSQAIGPLATREKPVISTGINYPFSGAAATVGLAPSNRQANPELTWEETAMWNGGLDLGLWDSKITFVADVYRKHTYNLLLNKSLPGFVGPTHVTENVGEVENKGIEFNLGFMPVRGEKLTITSNITFNRNLNKVLALVNDEPIEKGTSVVAGIPVNPTRIEVGKPISTFRGYVYEGVYQLGEEEEAAKFGKKPGDAKYKDVTPDGKLTVDDITTIGDGNPDFTFGWNTNIDWKGLSLNLLFTGSYGNDIYSFMRGMMMGLAGSDPMLNDFLNHWTPENPSNIPAGSDGTQILSSQFLEDGSHIALKNVGLSYTFHRNKVFNSIGMDALRLHGAIENAFFLTKYTGFDPESTRYGNDVDLGIDRDAYPLSRKFTLGINLTF